MLLTEEIKSNPLIEKGETYYKSIDEVYCPYFQEKIIFNAKGLDVQGISEQRIFELNRSNHSAMVLQNMTNRPNVYKMMKQKTPLFAMFFGGTWLRFGQTLTVRGQAHPSANTSIHDFQD